MLMVQKLRIVGNLCDYLYRNIIIYNFINIGSGSSNVIKIAILIKIIAAFKKLGINLKS